MEGFGSGQRAWGGDRRTEIVSGKGVGRRKNKKYANRSNSPDMPRIQESSKAWGFSDPEAKRKKRIAKYKVYTVEGKVKSTLKKGFRWIKNKCSMIVNRN